ncbi:hypothetical protein SO802_031154 [Lithocarpus litseifolius]|uniref:Maturase K n=1 Tax=Lithocarpus litseifolius TaxID=425828 RepID=A0AAW2BL87_9ROSI
MLVSKSWFSLIFDPYFVGRFIHHRHQLSRSNSCFEPFTLLLQYKESQKNILVLPSDNSELFIDCGGGGGGLDFLDLLPCIERARKNYPFCIKASFNDLLLVRSEVPPGCRPSFASIASVIRLPNNGSRSFIFPIHEGTTWLALYAIYVAVIKSRDVLRMPNTRGGSRNFF